MHNSNGSPVTGLKNNTETVTRKMPLYKVLLHNDDVNDMYHVIAALVSVFNMEDKEAINIMKEAHETGVALCKIEPLEYAEIHKEQLQSYSLTVTIEKE